MVHKRQDKLIDVIEVFYMTVWIIFSVIVTLMIIFAII